MNNGKLKIRTMRGKEDRKVIKGLTEKTLSDVMEVLKLDAKTADSFITRFYYLGVPVDSIVENAEELWNVDLDDMDSLDMELVEMLINE